MINKMKSVEEIENSTLYQVLKEGEFFFAVETEEQAKRIVDLRPDILTYEAQLLV